MLITEQPFIWTSKGNLEESSLEQRVVWTENENETICAVEHWLGDECVKRACHVYLKRGLSVLGVVGEF